MGDVPSGFHYSPRYHLDRETFFLIMVFFLETKCVYVEIFIWLSVKLIFLDFIT
jgi:hypothetical protein